MPPPISFIDIVTPFPFVQVVTQAMFNVANEQWFRFVNSGQIAFGNFTNKGGTFVPIIKLYQSDGSTLIRQINPIAGHTHGWYTVLNIGTYYIQITRNGGGASNFDFTTTFDTRPSNVLTYSDGDFLVNDDSSGFPALLMDLSGNIKSVITPIPGGEIGSILPSNIALWHDRYGTSGPIESFALFNSGLNYIGSTTNTFTHPPTSCSGLTNFYVVDRADITNPIYKIDSTGIVTLIGNLSASPIAIGVNETETILYWAEQIGNASIHRFDLIGLVPLSDLYTIPGYDLINDLLVTTPNNFPGDIVITPNGNVITWWYDLSVDNYKLLIIDSTGALLHEYNQGASLRLDHLAKIKSSDTVILIWLFTDSNLNRGIFGSLDIATGIITSFTTDLFNSEENLVDDSPVIFGPSASCTFLRLVVLPPAPPNPGSGIYKIVPGKRQDTAWNDDLTASFDTKIPDPFIKTGLIGE